ncbi:MAG: hypothetical protein QNJ73_12870 [Gammaproteobacteria bacterium]|nr:hypothetical protein [Gammaproteobacteria bacterium]
MHRFIVLILSAGAALSAEERTSTFQPFAVGDVFVAATVMDVPDDDHAGTGRLLQFDRNLQPKGVLWIEETTHKLGGLALGPDGVLWAFAPISWQVVEVGPDGKMMPLRSFGNRAFHSIAFAPDGSLLFGEHLVGANRKIPFNTTQFSYRPGTERIGDGHIFRYSADGRLLDEYASDVHGGMAGIHGVTSFVLEDDGNRVIYISETGNRVMQYDLANRRQLPDLAVFDGQDDRPGMVLVMSQMPDRTLVIATGNKLVLLDPDTGATGKIIPLESSGWAALSPSVDQGELLLGNFFTGEFVKLRLVDGEVTGRGTIGEQNSLSGIVQYGGRQVFRRGPGFGTGNPYESVIESSEKAFMLRDLEGSIENIDDDYVLYDIRDDGPVPRMQGKENVRRILGAFFSASDAWVDSRVDKWGLLDNILVQVEYDTYSDGAGTRTIPTLVVFEHRDGKRWREWRYRPQAR